MMSKILKGLIISIFILCISIFAVTEIVTRRGLPEYDGRVEVTGSGTFTSPVTVYRDKYGVAHIAADTEQDAYFALGFIHAQERLFQMDITRMLCAGRLTELIGDAPTDPGAFGHTSFLEQDKFNRIIGFREIGRTGAESLDPEAKNILESYSAGVNAYINSTKSLPPEFTFLRRKPEPWTPADTIMLGRFIAWGLSHNMKYEIMRLSAIGELGLERGWELFPRYPSIGPYIIDPSVKKYDPRGKLIPKNPLPVPPGILDGDVALALLRSDAANRSGPAIAGFEMASNNWVVSGDRSKSGKPILANDPHLIHTLPSVFFETHIVTKDGLDVIGVSFPGMPFITLGHNRNIAWAATTTRADVQDLFAEKVNPKNRNEYYHVDGWRPFKKRTEVFKIKTGKGFREERVTVRKSIHGVIVNDILKEAGKGSMPLALCWTGYIKTRDMNGFLSLARARDASEVKAALALIGSPVQNWMFADNKGNIGYFASGFYPVRARGDGTLPVPGWTGDYDWRGFIPVKEIPQLDNPSNGVIISANNAVLPEEDYPYTVSFTYERYRALRLKELLASKIKFTPADFEKFQHDTFSKQGERIAPLFVEAFDSAGDKKDKLAVIAADIIGKWDFRNEPDSIGATVFHSAYKAALELTFKDDLSERLYSDFMQLSDLENMTDPAFETGNSSFLDNKNTPRTETRDSILAEAVKIAAHRLADQFGNNPSSWKWGKIHTVTFGHPFGGLKILRPIFPVHEIPAFGSRFTVFNGFFLWGDEKFHVVGGPAYRSIVDMADIPGASMILDTGQSGHPRAPHFFDQNTKWLRGGMIPMNMDIEKIKKHNKGVLVLEPKK